MENEDILYQIKSLLKLVQRNFIKKDDKKAKPTTTQMEIMNYIFHCQKEKIYQKDLETALDIRRATVSEVLRTMEKNDLIRRKTNDSDLRSKEIIITAKAKKIFEEKKEKMTQLSHTLTKGITEDERKTFINIINKMKNNISKGE